MEAETVEMEFDAGTLVGDLRDGMLKELSVAHDKPWGLRPEAEQKAVVERIHSLARLMVREAVTAIVDNGFPQLPGKLEAVAVKDGFKATVKFSADVDDWEALIRAQGRNVVLVVAEPEHYFGTRGAVHIRPDQEPLPYADEAAAFVAAAEMPPDGWPVESTDPVGDAMAAETPTETEGAPAAGEANVIPEGAPSPDEGELVIVDEAAMASVMADYARFHVAPVCEATGTRYCWKDATGAVRCHVDEEQATLIAKRQAAEDEAEAWDTAEDVQTRRRIRKRAPTAGTAT